MLRSRSPTSTSEISGGIVASPSTSATKTDFAIDAYTSLKGAITGVLIGGGGVVAATEGQDVELDPGAVLRMRLDQPLEVRSTR